MPRTVAAKPQNDVYFGMLVTVIVAMLIGILCTFLETSEYPASKPPGSGLPKADALRAEMKPLAPEQGAMIAAPEEKPAVASVPTPPPAAPVAAPAALPPLPTVATATPTPPAPSGPTPSPVTVPPPTVMSKPASGGPTPSPLVIPQPGRR